MSERHPVSETHVQCPECDDAIRVPVYAETVPSSLHGQDLLTPSDPTPLWAHYETHAFLSTDD